MKKSVERECDRWSRTGSYICFPAGGTYPLQMETICWRPCAVRAWPRRLPCGGHGLCGKCRVPVDGAERLACRTVADRGMTVAVPEGAEQTRVLESGHGGLCFVHKNVRGQWVPPYDGHRHERRDGAWQQSAYDCLFHGGGHFPHGVGGLLA